MDQKFFKGIPFSEGINRILSEREIRKIMIVCDQACKKLNIAREIADSDLPQVWFSDFAPNPDYHSVKKGIRLFQNEKCDAVLAIGGGSAMDVAKCIKLYAAVRDDVNFLEQFPLENQIPVIAIPTTAGTGSEATRFAVIYYEGTKQSITHESVIPEYVFLNPELLKSLPDYQKKATSMDALCHAIESFWSINSTPKSREYSKEAIVKIQRSLDDYLEGSDAAAEEMLMAANIAGKAINITQTTAGHAMCYKLTSLFGVSHGHAAAVCVSELWPYMLEHVENCADPRGITYLKQMFHELGAIFGCSTPEDAAASFKSLLKKLALDTPKEVSDQQLALLVSSVNPIRLKNNPVGLTTEVLKQLYKNILCKNE